MTSPLSSFKHIETKYERDYNAKAMKDIRKLLRGSESTPCDCQACQTEWMNDQEKSLHMSAPWLAIWLGLVFWLCVFASCVHAEIPEDQAIKCVIGEAENQKFIGMLAVSHALRNRGTLKGCYGYNAPRVKHHLYSQKVYLMAKQAWEQSAIDYDITHKATGWGNASDLKSFAKCKWWRNCTITFMYRDHWFYKKVI